MQTQELSGRRNILFFIVYLFSWFSLFLYTYQLSSKPVQTLPLLTVYVSIPEPIMLSQSGKLRQGSLKTSRNNFLEANVLVEGMEKSVLIQGRLNINRALNDDTVAVELLPEDQWCRPANVIIDQEKQEEENKGGKDSDVKGQYIYTNLRLYRGCVCLDYKLIVMCVCR